jgi:hypothetical protein
MKTHSSRLISTDSTEIERWATGLNDYWPSIQTGLVHLPVEINAIAERLHEECKHEDEMINDHLDMLIELIQGYKVTKHRRFAICQLVIVCFD